MRLSLAKLLFVAAALGMAFGVHARVRGAALLEESELLAVQARRVAIEAVRAPSAVIHDREVGLLDARHQKAIHSVWWKRGGMLAFAVAVLLALGGWVAHELRLFQDLAADLDEAERRSGQGPRTPPASPG